MFGFGRPKRSMDKAEGPLHCAFCKKSQDDVRKLIAGPKVLICDDCVSVCVDIIVDDLRVAGPSDELRPSLEMQARLRAHRMNAQPPAGLVSTESIPEWHVRCGLCQLIVPTENAIQVEERGVLCDVCVVAVQAAAAGTAAGLQK
jgi:hypothetical protein